MFRKKHLRICKRVLENSSDEKSIETSKPAESSKNTESSVSETPEEMAEVIYDINDYKKLGLPEGYDISIDVIRAFLEKETDALEKFHLVEKGIYEPLKTLEFGEYSISRKYKNDPSVLIFNFTILSSGLDTLPPGEYSYFVDADLMGTIKNETLSPVQECLSKWLIIGSPYYKDFNSLDEFKQYAFELFGIENLEPDENEYSIIDGKYAVSAHGGRCWFYDFVSERKENDKTYVTIQFYAEPYEFIKSHLIEYEMQEKDGKWAFLGSRIIEESPYEPYVYGL